MEKTFKELLHESFKSEDTEEWLDVHLTRPVGLALALACKKLSIHPNTITIVSIFIGAVAGYMFYFTDIWHNVAGVALLMAANVCDSADGQLARLTNQKTLLGRVLDGFSGDVWFTAIYAAIMFRLIPQTMPFTDVTWGVWAFVLCALAGLICHSKQSSLADYYRQIHLFFLLGKEGSELDNAATQERKLKEVDEQYSRWYERLFFKAFFYNYRNYCRSQEARTPAFQALFISVREQYGGAENIPQSLRDEFRRGSLPLMKYTNILTFNARAITLYAACLLNIPYVYPLIEIVIFTVLYLRMRHRHEALCRRLLTAQGHKS